MGWVFTFLVLLAGLALGWACRRWHDIRCRYYYRRGLKSSLGASALELDPDGGESDPIVDLYQVARAKAASAGKRGAA